MNKRINNAKKGAMPNKAKALSCLMALLLLLRLYGCSKQETGSAVTSSNVIAEVEIPEEDGLAEGEALNREDVESIGETTEPGYGVTGSDVTDETTDDTTIEEGETSGTIEFNGCLLYTSSPPFLMVGGFSPSEVEGRPPNAL